MKLEIQTIDIKNYKVFKNASFKNIGKMNVLIEKMNIEYFD